MTDRAAIARQAAQALRRLADRTAACPVLLGFDGFVDSIIAVVDKRHDLQRFDAVRTIDHFARKIAGAAGMSSNYEMVVKLEKLGGNGPIMANAMGAFGFPVTYIGALGLPAVHPVFAPLQETARVHSIANPGLTDALEFDDGKLLLGKYGWLGDVNWAHLERSLGRQRLLDLLAPARMIGVVNWTMMPGLSDIWRHLLQELPRLPQGAADHQRRRLFIDLADPEKRTRADLREALDLCGRLQQVADVALGLNLKEATQVASALGLTPGADPEADLETLTPALRAKVGVECVVVHPRKSATASRLANGRVETATFHGPFYREPKLSTGAGDNFNAGFCVGLLGDMTLAQALCAGTAASGYYVSHAASASLTQLAAYCDDLPGAE